MANENDNVRVEGLREARERRDGKEEGKKWKCGINFVEKEE